MPGLNGQSALITGASSGIGRAIALELAREGVALHLLGRDAERLGAVAQEARAMGTAVEAHRVDLGSDREVANLVARLGQGGAGLDILVHSAGVISLGPVAEAPVVELDRHYRVNLRAPYLLTQGLLPALNPGGRIVFVNSGAGLHAHAGWSQYAISKFGLRALADSLRQELAPRGLRVTSVYPGRTAGPMQERVRQMEGKPYDPGALVQPEDVALQVVAALKVSPGAGVTDLSIRPG